MCLYLYVFVCEWVVFVYSVLLLGYTNAVSISNGVITTKNTIIRPPSSNSYLSFLYYKSCFPFLHFLRISFTTTLVISKTDHTHRLAFLYKVDYQYNEVQCISVYPSISQYIPVYLSISQYISVYLVHGLN